MFRYKCVRWTEIFFYIQFFPFFDIVVQLNQSNSIRFLFRFWFRFRNIMRHDCLLPIDDTAQLISLHREITLGSRDWNLNANFFFFFFRISLNAFELIVIDVMRKAGEYGVYGLWLTSQSFHKNVNQKLRESII